MVLKKRQPNSGSFKKGHKHSVEIIEKIRKKGRMKKGQTNSGSFKNGDVPWNKNKTEVYSEEMLEKMSNGLKKHFAEHGSHRKGKHHLVKAINKKIKKALDHINRFLAEREENKNRLPILLSDITNNKEILEE